MNHETVAITTDDGTCPAHVFFPPSETPLPAVLVYMDGIGMRPALHAIAERLASNGYFVLLPDLFYRAGAYTAPDPKLLFSDEAVRKAHFAKFTAPDTAARAMRDTRAFLAYLDGRREARADRIAVTGYCMGGRFALTAAGTYGARIAAAAAFHPGGLVTDAPDSPHNLAAQIRATIYVAGASEDVNFTDDHKQRLARALEDARVDHVIETYPARHGWVPSDTPVHDPACAERHWGALLELLPRTIGTTS
jgi:carboxymethylenebutenolidase